MIQELDRLPVDVSYGRVVRTTGLIVEAEGPGVWLGELCQILVEDGRGGRCSEVWSEVVGFNGDRVMLMPFTEVAGLSPGALVRASGTDLMVSTGAGLLGRVVDALGQPTDDRGSLGAVDRTRVTTEPPDPIRRPVIREALPMGVKAIDALLTCGRGQRIGIFAGAGVGKSTLLGMAVRGTSADVCVVALIGERGREVREFIDHDLGPEGLARSVVVVVPSSESPILRIKGAITAITLAESFRDDGKDVLFVMDSLTRLAMARREVGLAVGEPPTRGGYPPSVFSMLPRFLERAGTAERGSITGIYTVLVEGDDLSEPVADAARGLLDGHVVLSRELAGLGHYPAIDVLRSVSRLMPRVAGPEHQELAQRARQVLAEYAQIEDALHLGTYTPGADPKRDRIIAKRRGIMQFLRQRCEERWELSSTLEQLKTACKGKDRPRPARPAGDDLD
ncbi:MAG: FliI/YscN family ATPase [Candidatus Riflebacteria bacterium]|nr:FliI/YscN family ATPase [Candidatus Riflebacteria bacterium]